MFDGLSCTETIAVKSRKKNEHTVVESASCRSPVSQYSSLAAAAFRLCHRAVQTKIGGSSRLLNFTICTERFQLVCKKLRLDNYNVNQITAKWMGG